MRVSLDHAHIFATDVAAGRSGKVRLVVDRSRDRARTGIDQTEGLLRAFAGEWGRGRLLMRGVAPEVVSPLQVEVRDFATPQSTALGPKALWRST
jgi:hypothetical protein